MKTSTQIKLIALAEKHNLNIDDVEQLWYLKTCGSHKQYQQLLHQIKSK